jgi:hypothetical protein
VVFCSSHYSGQGYIKNNSRHSTEFTGADVATAGKRKKNSGIFCLVLQPVANVRELSFQTFLLETIPLSEFHSSLFLLCREIKSPTSIS